MKMHLLAMSRSKNTAKAFDQFSTLVERQHNRVNPSINPDIFS